MVRELARVEEPVMDDATEHTRPSDATRAEEAAEARRDHVPDRPPTDEEVEAARSAPKDPNAAAAYEEMAKRGANQEGEGRLP